MEIFVMLSLMTALASSASLDVDVCAEGESLCKSLAVAEACGAVDHCKETVWKNMNLEECRELIGEEELLQIEDSELALRMFCCSLGICNGDAILEHRENLPLEMKKKRLQFQEWSLSKASPPSNCRDCQKFFSSLQTLLNKSGSKDFLQNFLQVEICHRMTGVRKDMCLLAVKAYLPLILKLSLQFYDFTTICQQLQMCALKEDGFDQSEIGVDWNMRNILLIEDQNNTLNCSICKAVSEKVVDFLTKPNVTAVIENSLSSYLCSGPFFPFPVLCKALAKVLIRHIIEPLTNFLNATDLCVHFRICHKNTPMSLPKPAVELNGESTICQLCQNAFTLTIESAAVNKTEMTILNVMRMTCDSLWWPYVGYCHRMVNAVSRSTVEMLSQRLHPRGPCAMLGFCDAASDVDLIAPDIVASVASNRCAYCRSIAGYLVVLLGQERTGRQMQSHVKKICGLRPFGVDKEECESIVDKHAPMVVHALADDLSQDNFCQSASLCTGLTSDVVSMAAIPPAFSDLWPQFRCLDGPQFWCATSANAKLCQVEEYCGS